MTTQIKLFLIATVVLLCRTLSAQSAYFIDQDNGSDTTNCTSEATAFESIDFATGSVSPRDTILIIGV